MNLTYCYPIALGLSVLVFSQLAAVLPPYYESLKEYKTLINDEQLNEIFNSAEAIVDIQRENNAFIITTTQNTLVVTIEYEPMSQPGPALFKLNFGKPEPLKRGKGHQR